MVELPQFHSPRGGLNLCMPVALVQRFKMSQHRPPNPSGFLRYSQLRKIDQIEIFHFCFSKVVFRDLRMNSDGYTQQYIRESIRPNDPDRMVLIVFPLTAIVINCIPINNRPGALIDNRPGALVNNRPSHSGALERLLYWTYKEC